MGSKKAESNEITTGTNPSYNTTTAELCLVYTPDASGKLFTLYTDADHGGNPNNGRLTSGYILKIGTGAISWSLKLQTIVALSTTKAEYHVRVMNCTQFYF
jgi:hypothetical protein